MTDKAEPDCCTCAFFDVARYQDSTEACCTHPATRGELDRIDPQPPEKCVRMGLYRPRSRKKEETVVVIENVEELERKAETKGCRNCAHYNESINHCAQTGIPPLVDLEGPKRSNRCYAFDLYEPKNPQAEATQKLAPEAGRKYDAGKLDWTLLPTTALIPVVQVLMFGAKKYSRDNWQRVPDPVRRYHAALLRHIFAWANGEDLDPESKQHHLAHAACCLLFLMWFVVGKDEKA